MNTFLPLPFDSDLFAIAALTTTSYGRSLLTATSNITLIGSLTKAQLDTAVSDGNVAYVDQANTFVGNQAVTGNITASGTGTFTATTSGYTPALWVSDNNSTLGSALYFEWRGAGVGQKVRAFVVDSYGLSFYRMADGGGSLISSTPDFNIGTGGNVTVGSAPTSFLNGSLNAKAKATNLPALVVQGVSGQTVNLVEIINSTGTSVASVSPAGNITASGTGTLGTYTVATLPAASTNSYAEANVSDALSPTMGSTVASGGAVKTKVRSNGTNWTVCGI